MTPCPTNARCSANPRPWRNSKTPPSGCGPGCRHCMGRTPTGRWSGYSAVSRVLPWHDGDNDRGCQWLGRMANRFARSLRYLNVTGTSGPVPRPGGQRAPCPLATTGRPGSRPRRRGGGGACGGRHPLPPDGRLARSPRTANPRGPASVAVPRRPATAGEHSGPAVTGPDWSALAPPHRHVLDDPVRAAPSRVQRRHGGQVVEISAHRVGGTHRVRPHVDPRPGQHVVAGEDPPPVGVRSIT